jgi:hypothetical protein
MSTENTTKTTRYMDMTPDELRAAYRYWGEAQYNAGNIANLHAGAPRGSRTRNTAAANWGRANREFDLICNVARKRGIRLLA